MWPVMSAKQLPSERDCAFISGELRYASRSRGRGRPCLAGCDSSPDLQRMHAVVQRGVGVGADVEDQVEEAEVRDERAVALRVARMLEVLPDHADAAAAELLDIEIARRAAAAREIGARADLLAHVEDAIGLVPLQREPARPDDRHLDAEPGAREIAHAQVALEQARPRAAVDVADFLGVAREVRRAPE